MREDHIRIIVDIQLKDGRVSKLSQGARMGIQKSKVVLEDAGLKGVAAKRGKIPRNRGNIRKDKISLVVCIETTKLSSCGFFSI